MTKCLVFSLMGLVDQKNSFWLQTVRHTKNELLGRRWVLHRLILDLGSVSFRCRNDPNHKNSDLDWFIHNVTILLKSHYI